MPGTRPEGGSGSAPPLFRTKNSWVRGCGADDAFSNVHTWLLTTGAKPPATYDLSRLLLPLRASYTFAVQSGCSRPFKRRPVGGALAPVATSTSSHKVCRSGVCGCTDHLSGAWQERNRDHVWEKRCSRLDLLGCDLGSGYAAQDLRMLESELAYCSLRLRADVHAAPASSQDLDCPIAPPLCAPARVIPGRSLLEGEGRVGYRASPQLQNRPLFRRRWLSAVPIPVHPGPKSAQGFTGFSIAIAIDVAAPLAQQPVQPLPKVASCPLRYYSSGGYCVPSSGGNSRGAIEKREAGCPLGFYSSGGYCVSSPSNEREAIQKTGKGCPLGWYSSGAYCVKGR